MSLYFNIITIGQSRQSRNGNCFWITFYLGKRSSVIGIMRIYCILCTVRMLLAHRNTLCIHESFMTALSLWESFSLLCLSVVSHNETDVMTIICLLGFKKFSVLIFFHCLLHGTIVWYIMTEHIPRTKKNKNKNKNVHLFLSSWRSVPLNRI